MNEKVKKNRKKNNVFYGLLPQMKDFYKKELKTKQMWNFVIALFIYLILLITISFNLIDLSSLNIQNVDVYDSVDVYNIQEQLKETQVEQLNRFELLKNQVALVVVTIISGLTPYLYVPVLVTIVYPLVGAVAISNYSIIGIVFSTIIYIIELYIMSLIVSVGMYWCKMSTKHFRYNQSTSFTFNDVRLQFNEALKKEEKVEEIKKKMEANYEKVKALNEKTNYKAIIFFSITCAVLLSICTLITGV